MSGACRVLRWRPPRVALVLVAMAAIVHAIWPLVIVPPAPMLALVSGATGGAVMMRAWWLFRRTSNPIRPTEDARVLLTGDVCALSRNPMYLAMTLMLVAPALYSGSLSYYLAATVQAILLDRCSCAYGERRLERLFPDDYPLYRRNVRRWL